MSLTSRAIDRLNEARTMRWLTRIFRRANATDGIELRGQRTALRRIMRQIHLTIAAIDEHTSSGQQHIVAQRGSDWSWRPQVWASVQEGVPSVVSSGPLRLGNETAVFTDAPDGQVIARQTRLRASGDATLFGIKVEIFDFSGSYVSVVIDLPPSAARGLSLKHHLTAKIDISAETDLQCYAVLNLASGPNKERLVEGFRPSDRSIEVPFDLSKTHFDPHRVERLWLELIFEPKAMNAVQIRDLTLYRTLRREI